MTLRRAGLINSGSLLFVNLLWAAQYPAYKVAGDHMEPGALNFWTFVFASLLLFPFWMRSKARGPKLSGRDVWDFVLMGLLGILPPSVLLAWGVSHSSASNASILSLTIPVLMTLLGAILLGERLTLLRILSLGLGLIGTMFVSVQDLQHFSFSSELLAGNVVVLLAACGSAFYNVYGKRLLNRFPELEVLLYSYITGGLACALISAGFESKPFYVVTGYPVSAWISVAVLGFLSWGIAMIVWMWVLNRLDVGQISVSVYLLPFLGLLLSFITLHERLHIVQVVGGVVVLASTIFLAAYDKPNAESEHQLQRELNLP